MFDYYNLYDLILKIVTEQKKKRSNERQDKIIKICYLLNKKRTVAYMIKLKS